MNNLITGNVKYFTQTENREYINLLRKYPQFTHQEEIEAFNRYHNGDEKAKDEIILRNQRWVYSLAKEYARDEIEVMDYVNEGNVGLIEAVERFDLSLGIKFISYCVWYIRREMNAYLMSKRDLMIKSNQAKIGKKVDKIKSKFFAENCRFPTCDELKEILLEKYNTKIINDSDLYNLDVSSIDVPLDEETSTYNGVTDFLESTASENEYLVNENQDYYKQLVTPIISKLPKQSQDIIRKLYNIDNNNEKQYTYLEVCEEYGLDEEGMKKTEANILLYMKQIIKINRIKKETVNKTKKALLFKDISDSERNEIITKINNYIDSCFNEQSSNYDAKEDIQETKKKIDNYVFELMRNLKEFRTAI